MVFNFLYKRLEKERFKIPKLVAARCITYEQLRWLFDGLDIDKITGFQPLKYSKYF
jgi:IS66 Orf2 like protein